jgi:hypothetical protein
VEPVFKSPERPLSELRSIADIEDEVCLITHSPTQISTYRQLDTHIIIIIIVVVIVVVVVIVIIIIIIIITTPYTFAQFTDVCHFPLLMTLL